MSKIVYTEFDSKSLAFGKARGKLSVWLFRAGLFIAITMLLAVVVYLLFSLFFSTDTERALKREIAMYERLYPRFTPREELIGDAVALLQYKDNDIYEQVFHSTAPNVDPMGDLHLLYAVDTIPDTKWTSYTRDKSSALVEQAARIDEAFADIFSALSREDTPCPPMSLPIPGVSYPQIGASVGQKFNPFYKAYVSHDGLDIIVTRGTAVFASEAGTVLRAESSRSSGNTVEIQHPSGYTTIYAHLERMTVRKGQSVKRGERIGTVGMSGKASAPHLHYEVRRDSLILNPINCIFASVSPEEYTNMLYMSTNTKQSMD